MRQRRRQAKSVVPFARGSIIGMDEREENVPLVSKRFGNTECTLAVIDACVILQMSTSGRRFFLDITKPWYVLLPAPI